jgi:hypothetical protein
MEEKFTELGVDYKQHIPLWPHHDKFNGTAKGHNYLISAMHTEEVEPDHQCPHGWKQYQQMGFVGCTQAATEETDRRKACTLASICQISEFVNNNPEWATTNYVSYIQDVQHYGPWVVSTYNNHHNSLFVVPSHLNKSLMYSLGYHHLKQLEYMGARLAQLIEACYIATKMNGGNQSSIYFHHLIHQIQQGGSLPCLPPQCDFVLFANQYLGGSPVLGIHSSRLSLILLNQLNCGRRCMDCAKFYLL